MAPDNPQWPKRRSQNPAEHGRTRPRPGMTNDSPEGGEPSGGHLAGQIGKLQILPQGEILSAPSIYIMHLYKDSLTNQVVLV